MMRKYTIDEIEACLPPAASTIEMPARVSTAIATLPGQKASVFESRTFPDMNTAAQAGLSWQAFEGLSSARQNAMLEAILTFGPIIMLADSPRPEWLRIIFSLVDAEQLGATEAYRLALEWSKTSNRFVSEASFIKDWNSFKPGSVTVGTLLWHARIAGFDFDPWFTPWASSAAPAQPVQAATTVGSDPFGALIGWLDPDQIDFLYGGMLARGFVSLVGAAGGTGKSALMAVIATCCALGLPLLGEEVSKPMRVFSVNLEDSRRKHLRGFKATVQYYQLKEQDLDGWLFLAGADDVAKAIPGGLRLIVIDPATRREMINWAAIDWLRSEIVRRAIDVLMLDPFSRLIRGNENAVDVVDQLMEHLALLATETKIAILVAQHVRKSGGGIESDGVSALRGSSAVVDGARNAYGLTKPTPEKIIQMGAFTQTNLFEMTHLKGNLSRLDKPSFFELVGVRFPGGDPKIDPPQVERGRWAHTVQSFTPISASLSITDPMRNAVMVIVDGQIPDKNGRLVPFASPPASNNGKNLRRGARNPVAAAASALQVIIIGLADYAANVLAVAVLADLMKKGYISNEKFVLPSYKKGTSKSNGSNDGVGLVCHFEVTTWRRPAPVAAQLIHDAVPQPDNPAADATLAPPPGGCALQPARETEPVGQDDAPGGADE